MNIESESFWRALHSAWIDMLAGQDRENIEAIVTVMGVPTFDQFIDALEVTFLRAIPWRNDEGIPCIRIEVYAGDAYVGMGAVGAEGLGIDPDLVGREFDEGIEESIQALLSEPL